MKTALKKEIYDYLKNGGSEEQRAKLIKSMECEMNYVDIDCMSVCTDDIGCANLTEEQLEEVAEKLEDRLMEDFNNQLSDVIMELGY